MHTGSLSTMPDPVIKREESPERPIMAVPAFPTAVSVSSGLVTSISSKSNTEDTRQPTPRARITADHARRVPGNSESSSPHRDNSNGKNSPRGKISACTSPVWAHLPSRPISTMATGRDYTTTVVTNTTTSTIPTLIRLRQLLQEHKHYTRKDRNNMEENNNDKGGGTGEETKRRVQSPVSSTQGEIYRLFRLAKACYRSNYSLPGFSAYKR